MQCAPSTTVAVQWGLEWECLWA